LFDLQIDPHEVKNVYTDPGYSNVVRTLKAELKRLRTELDDHGQYSDIQENGN
jgi:hypothetical protein